MRSVSFGSADASATLASAKAHSLALANFCARLSGVLDHQIPDYWSFTALSTAILYYSKTCLI
jgi:hypothetical protein